AGHDLEGMGMEIGRAPPQILLEATISRNKRIIGPGLRSRDPDTQHTEAMIGVDIFNHMYKFYRTITEQIGRKANLTSQPTAPISGATNWCQFDP
ncbi:MAG: hypothetical protein ACR2Q4_03805, partial [Geminicoccaceae bacterium]